MGLHEDPGATGDYTALITHTKGAFQHILPASQKFPSSLG